MAKTIDITDSRSLTSAIHLIPAPEPFAMKNVFKKKYYHTADKVDIDIRRGSDNIAHLVGADEDAKVINKMQGMVKTVTIPRTFEKQIFSAYQLSDFNTAGNIYVANASDREKIAYTMIIDHLTDLKNRAIRRREQMACEALATGKIVVTQENFNFTMDFDFEVNKHIVTLAAAAKWDAPGASPVSDILKWRMAIARRSGTSPNLLIVGTDALEVMLKSPDVKEALDRSKFQVGELELREKASGSGVWLGKLQGIDLYAYSQQYSNGSTVVDMVPAKKVILIATDNTGFRQHFGPAYRVEEGKLSVHTQEILVETHTNLDRTAMEWRVEQKCLPAIHEPDALMSVTVV